MLGNKEIFARNLKKYMELNGVQAADICTALGFKRNSFSDWVNAKSYPRIDKIEMLANYLHTTKAQLVEDSERRYDYSLNLSKDSDPILIELLETSQDFTEEQQQRLLEYAKMLKQYKEDK